MYCFASPLDGTFLTYIYIRKNQKLEPELENSFTFFSISFSLSKILLYHVPKSTALRQTGRFCVIESVGNI
jgi:hypothetical protein